MKFVILKTKCLYLIMNRLNLEKENISEKKFKIIVKINTLSNTWNIIESVRFKIWLGYSKFLRNSIGMIYFQKSEIIPKKIMDYLFLIF